MNQLATATVPADSGKLALLPGLDLEKVGFGYDSRTQWFVGKQIFQGTSPDEAREDELIATIGDTDYLRPANLTTAADPQGEEGWAYSRSVQEFKNEYLLDTKVQVGYEGQDMKARFSIDETSEQASEHVYATISERVVIFRLTVIEATRSRLTAAAKAAIDDLSLAPEDLFATWGTHVLVSAHMGGAYELNAHLEKSRNFKEQEIQVGLQAKGSGMGIKVDSSVDYSSISSTLREQLDAGSKTTRFGGDPTLASNLDKWRKSIPDFPQAIAMLSLIPISDLAEGRRKTELENALELLLAPGLTGAESFGETIFGPADESAADWHAFVSPTKFGFISSQHAGDDALLSVSLPAPKPQGGTAGWNVAGSYFQVKHRDNKDHPDDGNTYDDGRFHHAIVPSVSARLVEIAQSPETDLEQGVVIYPTDQKGERITDPAAWKRWQLVIAPSLIGESEPGSNSDNALLGYECTATADDQLLQWTVTGTYLYRFNNSGLQKRRPAGAVRCLLLENPDDDPKEDLYRTGLIEDGEGIVAPTGSCDDWLILLSPVRMGINEGAGDHDAMLQVECKASITGTRTWKVSARCTVRHKSGLNDGDREAIGGRCSYLLIRRPGA